MSSGYVDLVDEQLKNSKTIAVVGLSNNPDRDSHRVASYLQGQGYRIIPVKPGDRGSSGRKELPRFKVGARGHRHGGRCSAGPIRSCQWWDEAIKVWRQIYLDAGRRHQRGSEGQGGGCRHPGHHERLRFAPAPPTVWRVAHPLRVCLIELLS